MSRLIETLRSGRILLMDGAMGTELQRAGMADGACYEAWNLTHPERVAAIHKAYADAGAEVFLTNTFQANPLALARHALEHRLHDIVAAGVKLARAAAGGSRLVLAAFAPVNGLTCEHLMRMTTAAGGADGILLETLSDPGWVAALAPSSSWNYVELPLFCSYTFATHPGRSAAEMERRMDAAIHLGVAGLGINCGRDIDIDFAAGVIRYYRSRTDLPLFARPNAGTPTRANGVWLYPWTPQFMAERVHKLLDSGASMVGGCCGTTPAHIAAFRPIIAQANATDCV